LNYTTTISGWTAAGDGNNNYDFIFSGSTADSVGANGIDGNVSLWGPHTPVGSNPTTGPVNNGLMDSPNGGNFLGIDPNYTPRLGNSTFQNSVSQSLTGLTAGASYTLSFYWAAAQQSGFTGATTEWWDFGMGAGSTVNTSLSTTTIDNPSQGFSGWKLVSLNITPTSSTELLTFLAGGTGGSGEPPFDLLDGVSLTRNTVPDSSSTAGLLGLGVVAMGVAAGCRRFVRA